MIPFGPWLPDRPSLGHPGVVQLENAFPAARGFRSVQGKTQITEPTLKVSAYSTGAITVPASTTNMPKIKGICSTVSINSNTLETQIFVGTETAIYKVDGNDNAFTPFNYAPLSPPAQTDPTYTGVARWRFAEFSTTGGARSVYAAGGTQQPLQSFLSNGTAAPAAVTGAPNAVHLCVVGRFLVCGNTAVSEAQVRWSQIDDAQSWTEGSNQADSQILADASEVTGMVGGETGTILTREGIYKMTFVGAPLVFTFDKVVNKGCEFAGSVASLSSEDVFYLSEDGFQRYKSGQVQNIGAEAVNDFFFKDFDRNAALDLNCVVDPANDLVIWSYASFGGNTTNNRLLAYNYVLDTWGIATVEHDHIGLARQLGKTLEQLAAGDAVTFAGSLNSLINAQVAEGGSGSEVSLDNMTTSLDSARFAGGPAILTLAAPTRLGPDTAADSSALMSLDGETLPLTIVTGEMELAPGRHVLTRSVMPHIEASDVNTAIAASVGSRSRQIDPLIFNEPQPLSLTNTIPARRQGRYFALRFTATGAWSQAFGFTVEASPVGRR